MKKMILLMLGLGGSILNTACSIDTVGSDEVRTQAIYQNYDVTYDSDTNQTTMWAQFRVGGSLGTTVSLKQPSSVTANDIALREHNFLGTYYSTSRPGLVSNITFKWVSDDSGSFINSVTIKPITVLSAPTSVNLGSYYEVQVSAPGYAAGEFVVAAITQDSLYERVVGTYNSSTGKVLFSPTELSKLTPGPAKLSVERHYWPGLYASTREGGHINASYLAPRTSIMVFDSAGASQPLAQR